MNTGAAGSLSAVLDWASRDVRRILVGVLDGGELSVESDEGRGSRFIVTLPAAAAVN